MAPDKGKPRQLGLSGVVSAEGSRAQAAEASPQYVARYFVPAIELSPLFFNVGRSFGPIARLFGRISAGRWEPIEVARSSKLAELRASGDQREVHFDTTVIITGVPRDPDFLRDNSPPLISKETESEPSSTRHPLDSRSRLRARRRSSHRPTSGSPLAKRRRTVIPVRSRKLGLPSKAVA